MRFETKVVEGIAMVRATQGHSSPQVEDDLYLERLSIDSCEFPNFCVHGTYWDHIDSIRREGLRAGGVLGQKRRTHVHFVTSLLGECGKLDSGMSRDCEIGIWVDVVAALKGGLLFFRSSNGVILTPGIQGVVGPQYFSIIVVFDGEQSDILEGI
jgi:2'-phosphotransferase